AATDQVLAQAVPAALPLSLQGPAGLPPVPPRPQASATKRSATANETALRQLADQLQLPADEVAKSHLTLAQLVKFLEDYQKVASDDVHAPGLWQQVSTQGTGAALKGAFVKTMGLAVDSVRGL